jgi:hypothetical protein
MAACGIACCSKCGTSDRVVIQVPAFKASRLLPSNVSERFSAAYEFGWFAEVIDSEETLVVAT